MSHPLIDPFCKRRSALFAVLPILLFVSACITTQPVADERTNVVVSILPQEDFVRNIGGDRVMVTVMIPPGESPASYEPSPQQLKNLADAQLYIRVGLIPFEQANMASLVSLNPGMKVVDCSEGIQIEGNDPHTWLSPRLAKIHSECICQALAQADPLNRDSYFQNLQEYQEELELLDARLNKTLSKVENRKLLVFHPAWGYFASDYGFEQISIEVEGKEPTAKEITNIIDTAKRENIRVIFVQKQFNPKSAQAIADQINASIVFIDPLPSEYIRNMESIADAISQE